MDYSELLFAYHVQKEAEQLLAADPRALTQQEFDVAMDEAVSQIIGEIAITARRIKMLANAPD